MNVNKNILHNKYLLYVIFILSFGNFFMEMMNENMYFVAAYILIGFLTAFFNKNMIVILSMAVIFANILKYGAKSSVEGFESQHEEDENEDEDEEIIEGIQDKKTDFDKCMDKCTSKYGNDSAKLIECITKCSTKYVKPDLDNASKDGPDNGVKGKTTSNKDGFKQYTDQDLNEMDYEKTEQLIKNQKQILKNMREYKPFLDTIQGLTKNLSGFVNSDD